MKRTDIHVRRYLTKDKKMELTGEVEIIRVEPHGDEYYVHLYSTHVWDDGEE